LSGEVPQTPHLVGGEGWVGEEREGRGREGAREGGRAERDMRV